jgi:hypothetical protein
MITANGGRIYEVRVRKRSFRNEEFRKFGVARSDETLAARQRVRRRCNSPSVATEWRAARRDISSQRFGALRSGGKSKHKSWYYY